MQGRGVEGTRVFHEHLVPRASHDEDPRLSPHGVRHLLSLACVHPVMLPVQKGDRRCCGPELLKPLEEARAQRRLGPPAKVKQSAEAVLCAAGLCKELVHVLRNGLIVKLASASMLRPLKASADKQPDQSPATRTQGSHSCLRCPMSGPHHFYEVDESPTSPRQLLAQRWHGKGTVLLLTQANGTCQNQLLHVLRVRHCVQGREITTEAVAKQDHALETARLSPSFDPFHEERLASFHTASQWEARTS
mmetsp:Transcript_5159/g.14477  ORF Transcript_5159/g.14477 Transcript_5159/m.14477 type:complete len:248 (-) Transcript_5159:352-1095(-)